LNAEEEHAYLQGILIKDRLITNKKFEHLKLCRWNVLVEGKNFETVINVGKQELLVTDVLHIRDHLIRLPYNLVDTNFRIIVDASLNLALVIRGSVQ